jgi:hypothetical protein
MTAKTVFVIGDSYSYHDNVHYTKSWPALLTDIDVDLTVVNGSIPGSSIDSLFYRYLEMEKQFGKPDLVLPVLTLPWRIWYMTDMDPLLCLESVKDRYHVSVNYKKSYIVPIAFGNKERERLLEQQTQQSITDLKTIFRLHSDDHHQWWRLVKEVHLLNSYCDNVMFMSWTHGHHEWLSSMPINYIGTVAELIGDDFESCKIANDDDHFTEPGHARFAPVIYDKIKQCL